jgi:quercetin dioxygenase-like cupin family protein
LKPPPKNRRGFFLPLYSENKINCMETNEFEKSKIFNLNDSVEYSDHGIVSKTILKKQTGNISVFSFDRGEGLSEHTAPFDAMIMVLDGKGEIIIGGKPFILEAGQNIIMPGNIPHAVNAIDKFKMMLIMIRSN